MSAIGNPSASAGTLGAPPVQMDGDAFSRFLRPITGDLLVHLYKYLKANVGTHPQLAQALPVLTQAAGHYQAGAYVNVFWESFAVYQYIDGLRQQIAGLPEPSLTTSD